MYFQLELVIVKHFEGTLTDCIDLQRSVFSEKSSIMFVIVDSSIDSPCFVWKEESTELVLIQENQKMT